MNGGRPQPRHWIWVEPLLNVILGEELHPDYGKYINHNDQDEGQVTQGTNGRYDDAQQDLHRGPGLRQFEDTQLNGGCHKMWVNNCKIYVT